jgi:hypothetical protein
MGRAVGKSMYAADGSWINTFEQGLEACYLLEDGFKVDVYHVWWPEYFLPDCASWRWQAHPLHITSAIGWHTHDRGMMGSWCHRPQIDSG